MNDRPQSTSFAMAQRSLGDPSITYPLFPVLLGRVPADQHGPIDSIHWRWPMTTPRLDLSLFDQSPLPGH